MIDPNDIGMEFARPAMEVRPDYDDATGEFIGFDEHTLSMKDEVDEYQPQEQEYQPQQESEEGIHMYSIEEVDRLLEDSRDEPDERLSEVAWNLDLPQGVPGLDLVQILSSKYLNGSLSYEAALDEAFSHGLSEQQLLKAYSIFNAHYNRALGR